MLNKLNTVSRSVAALGAVFMPIMMFLNVGDVAGRYFFNSPITGTVELTELMMVLLYFLGLGYTGITKSHVSIDLVTQRFTKRTQTVLGYIGSFIGAGVFTLMTWACVSLASTQLSGHDSTAILGLPIYPFPIVMALGSALLAVVFFTDLLSLRRSMKR